MGIINFEIVELIAKIGEAGKWNLGIFRIKIRACPDSQQSAPHIGHIAGFQSIKPRKLEW